MHHLRIPFLIAVLACGLLIAACDDGDGTESAPAPAYEVVAEDVACDFLLPRGQEGVARCGTVAVPENRDESDGRRIRLAFAVLRASGGAEDESSPPAGWSPAPLAPLLVLDGGPGASTLEGLMRNWFSADFAGPVQDERDIVFFDYRGTGRSEPDMTCPALDAMGAFAPEAEAREALLACRDRIVGEGADLDQYNSASMAADAADVMRALGYERYSVFGVSYGTRVALTMLRDNPAPIDGVVLDSVYPPQVDLYAGLVLHQQEALERGLGACAEDAACAAAYPDIVERMYALVAGATEAPLKVSYTDAEAGERTATVDGRRLLGVFIRAVMDTSYLGSLPKLISEIEGGEYGQLSSIVATQAGAGPTGSVALRQTVLGSEELPFADATAIAEEGAQVRPEVSDTGINVVDADELATEKAFNEAWGVAARPVLETEPVSSDVPVLILAGELDPTTPRAWADLAAETLSRSTVVEFRGLGHSVLFQRQRDCVMEIVAAFVAAPSDAVDASCAEGLTGPVWILP